MSVIYIILIVILDYIFVIFHLEKAQKYFMQLYFNSLFSVLILNLFFFSFSFWPQGFLLHACRWWIWLKPRFIDFCFLIQCSRKLTSRILYLQDRLIIRPYMIRLWMRIIPSSRVTEFPPLHLQRTLMWPRTMPYQVSHRRETYLMKFLGL